MSVNDASLALRLEGPLQSWGYDSQFDYRKTGLMPTKSGIAGLCCAAMRIDRGGEREHEFLKQFREVSMLAVSIPRRHPTIENTTLEVRRLRDYHTVKNTRRANPDTKQKGDPAKGIKGCHLTYRFYLQDAMFGVILSGNRNFLHDMAKDLRDPKWGLWLGRKSCVPSAPIFAGVHNTESEALAVLLDGRTLGEFTHQREVSGFKAGNDTLPDQPYCFGSVDENREFAPRRVELWEANTLHQRFKE